jgi:hypothetical protein
MRDSSRPTLPPDPADGPRDHIVRLFDDDVSRADAVAAFVLEGEARDERVLLAITDDHWELVSNRLASANYPLAARLADGRLTVLDAATTLRGLVRCERPEPAAFDDLVGARVRQLTSEGPLRVYGELVDLLVAEGNFQGTFALERLWNDLTRQHPCRLLCGYWSVHFGDPRSREALQRICAAHSDVHCRPEDELGAWLLREDAGIAGVA